MIDVNHEVSMQLTVKEINLILDALGDRPYRTVFQIVSKIQTQAEEQLLNLDSQPEINELD